MYSGMSANEELLDDSDKERVADWIDRGDPEFRWFGFCFAEDAEVGDIIAGADDDG